MKKNKEIKNVYECTYLNDAQKKTQKLDKYQ